MWEQKNEREGRRQNTCSQRRIWTQNGIKMRESTMVQNQAILRHQKFTFPRAREWAKWASEQMSAAERARKARRAEQANEMSKWPSTYVGILVFSEPQCTGRRGSWELFLLWKWGKLWHILYTGNLPCCLLCPKTKGRRKEKGLGVVYPSLTWEDSWWFLLLFHFRDCQRRRRQTKVATLLVVETTAWVAFCLW